MIALTKRKSLHCSPVSGLDPQVYITPLNFHSAFFFILKKMSFPILFRIFNFLSGYSFV